VGARRGTTVTAVRAALTWCLAGLAGAMTLAHDGAAASGERGGARACIAIASDTDRLACYDREVRKTVEPTFAGRLSKTTDRFHVESPTLLRFQSDGPIFVLYLKSADDNAVVQNLHIGGRGEDTYLIERPGTYVLDVNGSESWRIWVEPQIRAEVEPQRDFKTN
jgi:hypothetical protein